MMTPCRDAFLLCLLALPSMTAQTHGDFTVVRTDQATLTIGSTCSQATPCNVRFGDKVYSFVKPETVKAGGGTGSVFIYVLAGRLIVGHSGCRITCSDGCAAQNGVTSFPADSIPLYGWDATDGHWQLGGRDFRAFLSTKTMIFADGLAAEQAPGQTTIRIDPTTVGLRTAVPPSANSKCVSGAWAADESYIYICIRPDTWRRAQLSTWGK
jgi:hypothetical protein